MEGGVVEANRAVIEGIGVLVEDEFEEVEGSHELVEKHDMPPKVHPGD